MSRFQLPPVKAPPQASPFTPWREFIPSQAERKYNPNQPRDPEGTSTGGQWSSDKDTNNDKGKRKDPDEYEYITPEEFIAAEFARAADDHDVTPEDIEAKLTPEQRELLRDTEDRIKPLVNTDKQFKDKNGKYSPERQELHERIIWDGVTDANGKFHPPLLSKEKIAAATPPEGQDPLFTILGGRGGSGKSSLKGREYDPRTSIKLDSDEIKAMLPEYQGWNAAQVHDEAGDIFDRVTEYVQGRKLNLVHDATMKSPDKAKALVNGFKEAGYKTHGAYMHAPRQIAATRSMYRYINGIKDYGQGRYVPVSVILSNINNEKAFDGLREGGFDTWAFYDNSKEGSPPVLISNSEGKPRR